MEHAQEVPQEKKHINQDDKPKSPTLISHYKSWWLTTGIEVIHKYLIILPLTNS